MRLNISGYCAVIAMMAVLSSVRAEAGMSTSLLLETCSALKDTTPTGFVEAPLRTKFKISNCTSFITGFVQGVRLMMDSAKKMKLKNGPQMFCLPDGVASPYQLGLMYNKYVEQHPEMLNYPAAATLTMALAHYYPCRGETSP